MQKRLNILTIIHFSDVYNIEPIRNLKKLKDGELIGGAARFTTKVKELARKEPLVLFSGDVLGPSRSKS